MYSLTIFQSNFDNKTHRLMSFGSWGEFANFLIDLSKLPRQGKKDAPLISPAIYEPGTTRANRNVIEWGRWAAVDVDDFTGDINGILNSLRGINTLLYSTASSLPEQPKFRIVFSLNRCVQAEEIRHFWFALNKSLGDLGDAQTKDSSRMYYVPADYEGAFNFVHRTGGVDLDVDALMNHFPYVEKTTNSFLDSLSEEMREKVISHRKSTMNNMGIQWTSYHDCPFVPRKMVSEYKSISGTGWYHQMYRLMVAIASNAIREKYPITSKQIAEMCKQLDLETGNWYENRPLEREAQSALQWAYANTYEE